MSLPRATLPHPGQVWDLATGDGAKRQKQSRAYAANSILGARGLYDNPLLGRDDEAVGEWSPPTIKLNWRVVPSLKSNYHEELQIQSLMFCKREMREKKDPHLVVMLSLPVLQWRLHVTSQQVAKVRALEDMNPEDYHPPNELAGAPAVNADKHSKALKSAKAEFDGHEYDQFWKHASVPEAVVAMWQLTGVLVTPSSTQGVRPGSERVVATETRGETTVTNYWGDLAYGGMHLWLIVKEEMFTGTGYVVTPDGLQRKNPMEGKGKDEYVPRFVPVVTDKKRVPLQDLAYMKGNEQCYGAPIYVGRVIRNQYRNTTGGQAAAKQSADQARGATIDMQKQGFARCLDVNLSIMCA